MKPQYHHGDLRRALLEAARDALRSGRAAQLSIRELARTIGVSPNAPYRHFADRDALFRALALAGYLEAAAALEGLGQNGSRAVGVVWGGLAQSDPELVALMTSANVATTRRWPMVWSAGFGLWSLRWPSISAIVPRPSSSPRPPPAGAWFMA